MRSNIRWIGLVACGAVALGVLVSPAQAVIQVDGNVLLSPNAEGPNYPVYADDPFTTTVNEGIPANGNRIDPFRSPTAQIEFEGRPVLNGAGIGDDENINFDIIVGRTSIGQMIINQSDLRDMDLIIGDEGVVNGIARRGTGTVRIEGFGSLYNNDPTIIPFLPPPFDPDNPTSPSQTPRDGEPGAASGFDLYVGRAGNGVLQLALGGRAEIHDAVIVADGAASVGTLLIDGVDSILQSGGLDIATNDDLIHYMIVGRFGNGTMSITNGGLSFNLSRTFTAGGGGGDDFFGAVVGSNEGYDANNAPAAGGDGTVIVDGLASKWTVGGILQIGGFHNSENADATPDLEGNDVVYGPNVGSGILHVNDGALVSIVSPPLPPGTFDPPEPINLVIGRFGRVELATGGRIELFGLLDLSDPDNPTQELTEGSVINDGVISGDGRISALQFRNRVLGDIRVGPGEELLIHTSGAFDPAATSPPDIYPHSNFGLIEVIGTPDARAEIEFERTSTGTTVPLSPNLPFLNLPILVGPPAANGRTGGEIVAQDSIMRFPSNITNSHKVSFTGGDNEVVGNFTNEGTVFIGGNGTTVTFVDEFIQVVGSNLTIGPNVSLVMFLDDVMLGGAGALNMTFGGRPDTQSVSHISAAETFLLGGTLNASLFVSNGNTQFSPQAGDQFEIINATGGLFGDFADVNLPGCLPTDVCFVGFPDFALNAYFIQAFSIAGAMGADFDGSGLVDALDLQIWRQNLGMTGPPGTLAGDANGDGIVNGQDFFIWQMQVGGPGMGAGAGGGNFAGNVPEPTSLALVSLGGMLALAVRRRASAIAA